MRSKWCTVAPFSLKCFFRGWSRCEAGKPGGDREPGATRTRDRGGVLAALSNSTTGGVPAWSPKDENDFVLAAGVQPIYNHPHAGRRVLAMRATKSLEAFEEKPSDHREVLEMLVC